MFLGRNGTQFAPAAMLWHRAYSLMGPLYGSCLLLRGLTLLLGCTACAYGLLVEGPGDALLPTLVLQLALAIRGFVFPPRGWSPALGLLRAMLPALSMSVVWVYWLGWAALPSEMLPSSFFEKNSFLLFGRNFTLYKAVEEKAEEDAKSADGEEAKDDGAADAEEEAPNNESNESGESGGTESSE